MNLPTAEITFSLPIETIDRLRAYTKAVNGSIHSQAAALIEAGVRTALAEGPQEFRLRYKHAFDSLKED